MWIRLLFVLLFLKGGFLSAQSPVFRQFLINSENSKLKYSSVFFDHQQLLWVGTSDGLYQFDGIDFNYYLLPGEDETSSVTALAEDANHVIWVGYSTGKIAYLKNDRLHLFSPEEGLPQKPITSITCATNGSVWFTTSGEGVYFYNRQRLYNINSDDGLNDDYTYTSVEDLKGNIWIGTDQGIALCRDNPKIKLVRKLTRSQHLPDEIIRVLKKDSKGNIWIGTQDKGICQYRIKENKLIIPVEFETWDLGQINSISIHGGDLWIATEKGGCINYNPSLFDGIRSFNSSDNIDFSKCNDLIFDQEGNSWIASQAGLIRCSANGFRSIDEGNVNQSSKIHSLLCTQSGEVYFAKDHFLSRISIRESNLDTKKFLITSFTTKADISCLFEDKHGLIWIGTMGSGLFCFDPQSGLKVQLPGFSDLNSSSILSLAVQNQKIWITTIGGVLQREITYPTSNSLGVQIKNLHQVTEIGNNIIYKVYFDSQGRCWFASDGNGLTCFDGVKYITYNSKNKIKSDIIFGITEDINKNIWFNTADAGIYSFDGKNFVNYGLKEGIHELNSSAIIADKSGIVYCVYQQGVDAIDVKTKRITYFGNEYKLNDINPDLNSVSIDQSGTVWVGTSKGLILLNSKFKSMIKQPISLIKRVSLLGNDSAYTNLALFKHDQNSLVFQFAGIWYSDPGRVRYRYLLKGYNKDWIETKDNQVVFPELPPGKYEFLLQTGLGKSFNQASQTSYAFQIKSPFWDEIWFRIPLILLILAAIYGYFKWRDGEIRRYQTLENEKVRFQLNTLKNQVNPHFLFNSFNTLISIIETDSAMAVKYVENLSEFFRNVVTSQNKDLISLKEELEHSSSYYFLQKKRFGNNLHIDFNIESAKEQLFLPPLVLQLLIENAIKHNVCSKDSPLYIRIESHDNHLVVSNNLNEKRTVEASTKTGLQNIIDRYKLLSSENIDILKTSTEFRVTLPLLTTEKA
jgi:ligand-binding sensor domain-containing protein